MNGNSDGPVEQCTIELQRLRRRIEQLEGFAEIVAHDLKEPLRGIRHYVDFVMQECGTELPEPAREMLTAVHRLAVRMTDRIEALYRYTGCHQWSPVITRIDLRQVVDDVLQDLQSWLDEHHACVTVADSLPCLECDSALLTEILHNLITNAVKYNDRPEPHIKIGRSADGALFVQDDGIGISEEDRERVFDMYRRLHAPGHYGGGTGAGLAIVRRLIERLGGRIWVESTLGQGTTFRFTLGTCT
jgi:two-component system, chemotaxis family, sensor kinase Cph1